MTVIIGIDPHKATHMACTARPASRHMRRIVIGCLVAGVLVLAAAPSASGQATTRRTIRRA